MIDCNPERWGFADVRSHVLREGDLAISKFALTCIGAGSDKAAKLGEALAQAESYRMSWAP